VNKNGMLWGLAIALLLSGCGDGSDPSSFLTNSDAVPSQADNVSPPAGVEAEGNPIMAAQVEQALLTDPDFIAQFEREQEQTRAEFIVEPEATAVAVVEDHALVEWSGAVGDLPLEGHALLRRQGDDWRILNRAIGYVPFGVNQEFLIELGVPEVQAVELLEQFWLAGAMLEPEVAAPFEVCVTVTDDATPPTNVRQIPTLEPDNIVGELPNGTTVMVDSASDDWLAVRTPQIGWISLNLTRVTCGDSADAVASNLERQAQRARTGNFRAIDTLVRYILSHEDETANQILAAIAGAHPRTLILVLDQYGAASRNQALSKLVAAMSATDRAALEEAIAQQSFDSAIAQSWRQVARGE
jgi:hypothetical protein